MVSIPDVEHWNVAALQQVFTVSQNAGKSLQKLGEGLDGTAAGLTDWMGPASEAWRSEHGKLRTDVTDQHGQTQAVGQIVNTAIDDVQWCINELRDARAPAEALGMKVNSDGSVTDPNAGKSSDQQEADHREQVRSAAEARLKHLLSVAGTTETEVSNGLRAAVGDPTAAIPANAPRPTQPPTKPAAAGEQPKPGEKPTGASDPLAQLLGVGDPNKPDPNSPWTKQAPPAQPDKPLTNPLDLLAGKDGTGAASEHPRTLQEMMLPGGPPTPPPKVPQPKFDPNTPEGKAGLAAARQVLVNDPRVPPAEIEQRLAAMTAQAEQPLQPPPAHDPGPKPPLPGLGERMGDAFNKFTNNMHEGFYDRGRETLDGLENLTGTGGPGHPGVADSWKQLAQGTVDDIRNDPLRWQAAQREGHEMVDNPGRYAGKTLFDGVAAAPGAALPGEGLLARGALEGAVERGVQHEVTHGAVSHDPVPAAPHPTVDVPDSADHGLIGHGGDAAPTHTGRLPETGEPGSYGYDGDGNRLPYANGGRPDFAPNQVEDTWHITRNEQLGQIGDGMLDLPTPGADQQWVLLHPEGPIGDDWTVHNGHRLIEWQPGDPRKGLWDMGHVPGEEYRITKHDYLSGDLSYQDFLDMYRDPNNYRVQDPYRNRSHIDEGP
ncbi:GH-E family nuclease [Mycobacteroides abscessus]|uniref:GH-E family nuclease n=1 Tax=Mycobacteroides abscessus TaxID=36809 RepID=UPI00210755D6|nr:HNH/ENDO VII family nuclease [Mycobacteroides abscessus]